jgi:spore germination protein KC
VRQFALALVLALISVTVVGCWDSVELEKRALVAGAGVDKADGQRLLRVTVQTIRAAAVKSEPSAKAGSQPAVTVFSGTGYSIGDAAANLQTVIGKPIFQAETQVVVMGEALARESIDRVIDFYERDREPPCRLCLLVARSTAGEVLETEVSANKIWAFGIAALAKSAAQYGRAPSVELGQFLAAVESQTTAPVIAGVEVIKRGDSQGKAEPGAAVPGKDVKVSGTAVFRKYCLVGWLDETETRGMLWVAGKVQRGVVLIPAPGQPDRPVAVRITRASSRIIPEAGPDGIPSIMVRVKEEGCVETVVDEPDLPQLAVTRQMEAQKEAAIKLEISAALAKARSLNADVFGFGEAIRRKFPKEWRRLGPEWDRLFSTLKVNVVVEARIRHSGSVDRPPTTTMRRYLDRRTGERVFLLDEHLKLESGRISPGLLSLAVQTGADMAYRKARDFMTAAYDAVRDDPTGGGVVLGLHLTVRPVSPQAEHQERAEGGWRTEDAGPGGDLRRRSARAGASAPASEGAGGPAGP